MKPNLPEPIVSVTHANDWISGIKGCETEADVEAVARQLVRFFDFQEFIFATLHKNGEQEHYRYHFGCAPEWIYRYIKNKWYAIDPFVAYALQNSNPVLASDIPLTSPGQQRRMASANEHGFHSAIVVPAHSAATPWVGVLYLVSSAGTDHMQRSLDAHRYLMRAFGMELLEWCDSKLYDNTMSDLDLDSLDIEMLLKAQCHLTAARAASELNITFSLAEWRYKQLLLKLSVASKQRAVEKAVALGIIKPIL